jgi:hypothetical protein
LPKIGRLDAIAASDAPASVAAARLDEATAVAWVTDFDPATPFARTKEPAPDGKYEAPRALLWLRLLPDHGAAPDATVVSYRAASAGGVAVASAAPPGGGTLLAWTGIDDRRPQVFVTLLGPDGKKVAQRMLTHGHDVPSEVALAPVADGFVVGWIAEHAGTTEVRVTKVDRSLKTLVPERRVGRAAATATGVELLARGDHVFVAWSDARGPRAGVADVYAGRLLATDLTLVGPERVVVETDDHSRSPALAPFGDGAAVAWVEDPSPGSEQSASQVMIAELDSGAEPVAGSVVRAELEGSPEGVGVACGADACRVAATVSTPSGGGIEAFTWRRDGAPPSRQIAALEGRPREAIAPVVVGGDVIYSDEHPSHGAIVRRAAVDW